jgi:hypothetical protein
MYYWMYDMVLKLFTLCNIEEIAISGEEMLGVNFTWTFHIFLFIYNRNIPTQHWPLISIRTCGHKTLVYEFCDRTRKNQERQTRTLPILYIHCSDWTTLEHQYQTGTWMLYSLPLIIEMRGQCCVGIFLL